MRRRATTPEASAAAAAAAPRRRRPSAVPSAVPARWAGASDGRFFLVAFVPSYGLASDAGGRRAVSTGSRAVAVVCRAVAACGGRGLTGRKPEQDTEAAWFCVSRSSNWFCVGNAAESKEELKGCRRPVPAASLGPAIVPGRPARALGAVGTGRGTGRWGRKPKIDALRAGRVAGRGAGRGEALGRCAEARDDPGTT